MAVNGWRHLLTEKDFNKVKRLADADGIFAVVSLQWQAESFPDLEERLRDVLGTIFTMKEIGGNLVCPVPENDLPKLFGNTIRWMNASGRRLWLDYGDRDKGIGNATDPEGTRVIGDFKHYYEFRVRPEGSPVGQD